jgi:hypothetical protein
MARRLYKYIIVVPMLLTGCAATLHKPAEPIIKDEAKYEALIAELQAAPMPIARLSSEEISASQPMPIMAAPKAYAPEAWIAHVPMSPPAVAAIIGYTARSKFSESAPPEKAESVREAIDTIEKSTKRLGRHTNTSAAIESTAPVVPTLPSNPSPAQHEPAAIAMDSRTGAKVQFLGMDLEFWLGQNDSWSTVFKMLTLLLVTYGGFRWINSIFGRRTRRRKLSTA